MTVWGADFLESVVERLIFVVSVVDVGLGKYIFVAFRTRLYGLGGRLTARIGQIQMNLTVASWPCPDAATKMSINRKFR